MSKLPIYVLLTIIIASCIRKPDSYLDANTQSEDNRVVESTIQPKKEILLENFEVTSPLNINVNNGNIVIPDFRKNSITLISKENLETYSVINISQGEGPGEVTRMNDVYAGESHLFVADNSLGRVLVVDYDGNLINEISIQSNANRIIAAPNTNPDRIIIYHTNPGMNLFKIYDLDGNIVRKFVDVSNESINPMMLGGRIHYSEETGSIFFVGRAEPLIKSFNLDGDELFSVKNIDNYDTSNNYLVREFEDGGRATSFSEDALFSANYSDVDQNYIYVIPSHNDNDEYKYIDKYHISDGMYEYSIELEAYSGFLSVGENYLYTLGGNENRDIVLKAYLKP
jgi:hypothetical protein